MAYTINKTDGTVLTDVLDNSVDRITTDLTLVGKNTANYGEFFNENFIKLLENFASSNPPRAPLKGQIWYDTNENKLKFYNGTQFKEFSRPVISSTEPTLAAGDLWIDNNRRQLYFNDGQGNRLAGPIYTAQQGLSGFEIVTIKDMAGTDRVIAKFKLGNTLVGIFSNHLMDGSSTSNTMPNYTSGQGLILASEGFVLPPIPPSTTPTPRPIKKGFNPVSLDFKFDVTVKNAENLVTQFGQPINVDQFVKTTGNNNINGRLEITGNDQTDPTMAKPLTLGYASNLTFEIAIPTSGSDLPLVKIRNQVTDQNLALVVRNTLGSKEAVFINANTSRVGIYNTDPLATLDIEGDVNFREDLVTNKSSINLFEQNATTISLGAAATLMNISSSQGDTIVNNNLTVRKDLLIEGGDLTSSTNTFNLVNTTSTTVNFAGAANTINIGSPFSNVNFTNNVNIGGTLAITGQMQIDQILIQDDSIIAVAPNDLKLTAVDGDIFLQRLTTAEENLVLNKRLVFDGLGIISVPVGFTRNFQLLNTIVDQISMGGDATNISIGSTTGTTNVNHNLQVFGDISIGAADSSPATIDSNGPLAHLFNTVAKEIYIGGQADEVNILYEPQVPGDPNPTLGKTFRVFAEDSYFDGDIELRGGDIRVPAGVTIATLFNNYATRVTIGSDAGLIELGGSATNTRVGGSLKIGQVAGEIELVSTISSGSVTKGEMNVGETTAFFDMLPTNVLDLKIAASADRIEIGRGSVPETNITLWQPTLTSGSNKTGAIYAGVSQIPIVIIRENLLVRNRLLIPEVDKGTSGGAGVLFKNINQELEGSPYIRLVGNALSVAGDLIVANNIVGTDLLGTAKIPRALINILDINTEIISDSPTMNIFNTDVTTINFGGANDSVINLGSATSITNIPGYIKHTWKTVTTTRQALSGDYLLIDTTTFNVTVTLPAAPDFGDEIHFADKNGISATRKLVINRNGNKINGLESDLEITTPNRRFTLTYTGVVRGWCWDRENWRVVSANYTARDGDKLMIDNSAALISNIIVTLPASAQVGDTIRFLDQKGLTALKPLIIQRNGHLINANASDLTISTAGAAFTLVYTGVTRGWCYDNV
jgi:hypothetical protein